MIQQASVSLEDAQRVIAAGIEKAREIGQPQNVAVVDAGAILSLTPVWMARGSEGSTSP